MDGFPLFGLKPSKLHKILKVAWDYTEVAYVTNATRGQPCSENLNQTDEILWEILWKKQLNQEN